MRVGAKKAARAVVAILLHTLLNSFQIAIAADPGLDLFEEKIRPVLVRHCYECHSAAATPPRGGLRLDSRDAVLAGGESGPALAAGKPAQSLLLEALRHESLEMPPKQKLPDHVIADFERWIELGASDPRDRAPTSEQVKQLTWQVSRDERMQWWSYQPVRDPTLPEVRSTEWPVQPLDRFILARLEASDAKPASNAARRVLIRRLSFVLTGLPPTPEDVEAFVESESPRVYEDLVDRLLTSPHMGERWARHWMDVAGYTDTYAYEVNFENRGAWRFRDYLIRAFNDDVPFDQLIREQIAGDLLEQPRWDRRHDFNESLIGPSFLQMGEFRFGDNLFMDGLTYEFLDHQIDNLTKAFQATTVACARCHDHKIDPVSTRDYYALAGVLMSSRWTTRTIDGDRVNAELESRLAQLKAAIRAELMRRWRTEISSLPAYLVAAEQGDARLGEASSTGSRTTSAELDARRLAAWRAALDKVVRPEAQQTPITLDHPLYAWAQLAAATKDSSASISALWNQIGNDYRTEARARASFNREHFTTWADFRHGHFDGWAPDGLGLRNGPVGAGQLVVTPAGKSAVRGLLPAGVFTHTASEVNNGALRSGLLPKDKKFVSLELMGDEYAAVRHVIDNSMLGAGRAQYLDRDQLGWLTLATHADEGPRYRIYLELITKWSSPVFPYKSTVFGSLTKPEDLDLPKYDFFRDPRSYFGVTRAVMHDVNEPPRQALEHLLPLFSFKAPGGLADAAERYRRLFQTALDAWTNEDATDAQIQLLNWLIAHDLLSNEIGDSPTLHELVAQHREVDARLSLPRIIDARADHGRGANEHIHVRGDVMDLGDEVDRGYLEFLTGSSGGFQVAGSGRLELAGEIANPNNPLTARVMVNRIWHYVFGAGLVSTVDDFGALGERPSHPELLDYLAARFVEEDWSVKSMIRRLVLSRTFRQSSQPTRFAQEADPANRLLSHYAGRRLDAEAIRDAILAVSGRWDRQLYGPPIEPHRLLSDMKLKLLILSGPVDGEGRRSVYTKIEVMAMPKFLSAFDQPLPRMTRGRRDVTNIPRQALTMLNDPFVHEMADHWAGQLIAADDGDISERLDRMLLEAVGRPASQRQLVQFESFVNQLAELRGVAAVDVLCHREIWTDVAHVIFNLSEFVHVQ